MPSIVDDFKAIHEAARLLEGGDDHYPVAQPMAVETENHIAWDAYADILPAKPGPMLGEDDLIAWS